MGAYDGGEVCELFENYLLDDPSKLYKKKNMGLYRDEGMVFFKNKSWTESEKIEKAIHSIFREKELKITI